MEELANAFQTVESAWAEPQLKFNAIEQVHDNSISEILMIKQELENTKQRLEASTGMIQQMQHSFGEIDQIKRRIQMMEDHLKAT